MKTAGILIVIIIIWVSLLYGKEEQVDVFRKLEKVSTKLFSAFRCVKFQDNIC